MARTCAEDVANEVGLAADELSNPCDSSIISSLALCFSEWRVIFGSLLSEVDLGDVNRENTTEEEKRIAALRKWKARNGSEATYKILVDALLNRGEKSEAESLCTILRHWNGTTTNDIDVKESESCINFQCPCGECLLESYLQDGCPKSCIPYLGMTSLSKEDQENLNYILKNDTKRIMKSFSDLSNETCDSLIRQGVTVDKLIRVTLNSDSSLYDKLMGSTSVDRVFSHLASEMSFFNHEILKDIINTFGDKDDKDRLGCYSKEFKEFCRRKVFEVESGRCPCGQRLKQRKPFAVILPTGEKRLRNLGDAVNIKEMLADILGIPLATLHLHRIDRGSVILVFSVPDSIAEELFPLPKEKTAFLREKGMVLFVPQDSKSESNRVENTTKLEGPDSTRDIPVLDGNASSYEVSGLRPYTTYPFSVSAMTEAGTRPAISISSTIPQERISETNILTFMVNFQGSRTVLHLPKDLKVGRAIQKAAEQFKTDPRGLIFLYHGLEITDNMTVGDALAKASHMMVVHLVKVSCTIKVSTARVPLSLIKNKSKLYAYCRECSSLSEAREVLICKNCGKYENFQRTSSEPVDHFSPQLDREKLKGVCSCKPDETSYASVKFECGACPPGNSASVLRQVRDNIHEVPCMKCAKKVDSMVFRFSCSQRHVMCLGCFSNYCQQMMNTNNFHGFGDMGYSVGCPGKGSDCANTPVPDPHHFKIVDDDLTFYYKYIDKSVCAIDPGESIILCTCRTLIDPGHSTEVTVQELAETTPAQPTSDGLRWYQRMFRRAQAQPKPPAPRKRHRVSCGQCQMQYCVECKQVWHEGDCKPITDAIRKEEKAFPIDEGRAVSGRWPLEEDK